MQAVIQNLLLENKFTCSMSRKGECYDNAVVESFFKSLKNDIDIEDFATKTKQQAKAEIFEYLEVFYNRERLHSSLDYKSPCKFEDENNIA